VFSQFLADAIVVAIFSSVSLAGAWAWQRKTQNAGIVDIVWAVCLAFAGLYYGSVGRGELLPRLLVALFASIWAFRLAGHLIVRVLNEDEDGRYRFLRNHWQNNQLKFFGFFQGQVLLVLLFSLPFYIACQNPIGHVSFYYIIGALIWLISIGGESIADAQLASFRNNPSNRGKTCTQGLWRYSRHPNYFFEWTHWFSYCCFAIGAANYWWSWIGPITMLITLCWVTGIPFVEAQSIRSRGDDYRRYQQSTSPLIPWFPRGG
jgi:steroid 5-alpha reductase family enzyme